MCRTTFEFGDLFAQPNEILLLVKQASAELNHSLRRAGHPFAEP